MTVNDALLKLWTHSRSDLGREDEKRLWMVLQAFVERNGGRHKDAYDFDTRGGRNRMEDIKPKPTLKKKVRDALKPLMG